MVPPVTRRALCIVFAAVWSFGWTSARAQGAETVRVAVLRDAVMARVSIDGYYRIEDASTHEVLATGRDLRGAVTAFKYALNIGGKRYRHGKLFLRADTPEGLEVNGRRYPGHLAIIRGRGAMTLVNHAGLEDYIRGIAVREISHYWPSEALRAHAIVFRTYALYAMKQNASRDYDVTGDVYSQVYGGTAAMRYRITDACAETAGDVLTYRGSVFPAYYHSTCGGHTADASALWDIDLPVLAGVDCVYCKGSPHFSWRAAFPVDQFVARLAQGGVDADGLRAAEALDIDRSGRIRTVILHRRSKAAAVVAAKDLRGIIGPDVLKSTNFTVSVRGNTIEFSGNGWGHGAGLCQWGAYFMAKAGYTCADILAFYYPGSQIKNIHRHDIPQ